jgi:ABC-type transporter Mla subunit MlaD
MPAERNAFKLGATMILFLVLLVGILVFFAPRGGGDVTFKVRYPHTRITTVLKPGGLVRCGGGTVGSIVSLDLQEMKDPASAVPTLFSVIAFRVDSTVGLRKDCKITPVGPLLGEGGQLVILDRGDGPKLAEGSMIEGNPGADMTSLMQTIADQLDAKDPTSLLGMLSGQFNSGDPKSMIGKILKSLDDVNAVTASLSKEFDAKEKVALIAKLHGIMDNINEATSLLRDQMDQTKDAAMMARLNRTLDTLQGGLQAVVTMLNENREPLTETVASIRNTSVLLEKQIAARIAEQLDTSNAASLLAKVHVSLDRLGKSLEDMNAITGAAREVIVLRKEQIGTMLANFKETSDHLKGAAADIRRSPWRLFYQPTMDEVAQANVFDAARAFSDAAAKLDDAAARLQAISTTGAEPAAVRDEQMLKIRDQLKQTFADFTKVEAALWQQLNIK